ncbi:hypothetical protein QSJ18_18190 [Gordonia sp. ABSL1-1]|uniref:hypothetical protein n=1 Tax=Gordonia sp. ABSL1-1 TaxID=3053923 RepID=UPI00257302B8|nr:hypothetical protein [Gordonia sp. ABSL1-1]MDL9938680.1 hypothetical protein [Gordonia sp. ABSL1-1]
MEADLSAIHGIDLIDFYRGSLTARRLWALVEDLLTYRAHESSLARRVNNDHHVFSLTDYLLADLWELKAKSMSENAPDAHPWRNPEEAEAEAARQQARDQKMIERQQRYAKPVTSSRGD